MRLPHRRERGVLAVLAALILAAMALGCSDDDSTVSPTPVGSVLFHMTHNAGAEELELGQLNYTTTAGDEFSVTRLQYYISKIEFRGPDGNFETDAIHFTDATDPDTHSFSIDGIPPRHYHNVVFTFGLEDDQNLSQTDPDLHPELTRTGHMVWPDGVGGGFHYMKLEGRYRQEDSPEGGYNTHMGRCPVPAGGSLRSHAFQVMLTAHLTVEEGNANHVELIMDVKKWYEAPNLVSLADHGMIMANGDAQLQLQQNGQGHEGAGHVWYLGDVDGGEHP